MTFRILSSDHDLQNFFFRTFQKPFSASSADLLQNMIFETSALKPLDIFFRPA
jgi:hypothetical protein